MKAVWCGVVIAQSDDTVVVEGNHYFLPSDVKMEYLAPSSSRSTCPWKGIASYYSITVGAHVNEDAAWYYPRTKSAADHIRGRIAFWRGVEIQP